jgi:hypothetical protein
VDWIQLVHDRMQWHAYVKVIVNLRAVGEDRNISCILSSRHIFKFNHDHIMSSEVISRVIRETQAAEHGRSTN